MRLISRSFVATAMTVLLFAGVLNVIVVAPTQAQDQEVLTRAHWPAEPTGKSMLRIESLQRVIARLQQTPTSLVLVRFPGGNRGNAWAYELRDWMVALGLDSGRIRLESGSAVPEAITLTVLNN